MTAYDPPLRPSVWPYPPEPMRRNHEPSLGEQVHTALVKSAEAKNEALLRRKKAERVYSAALLCVSGTVEEKKAKATLDPSYQEYDDKAIEAEHAANIARAEADGMQVRFDEWQSNNANEREAMKLR